MVLPADKPHEKKIIIVSGLPRSGTSLMMKMLQAAGFELVVDNLRSADQFNPEGYFEFEPVKNLKTGDSNWLKEAGGRVLKVVSPLLQYLPRSFQYKIVFMQRDMSEVLASQSKMLEGKHKTTPPEQNVLLEKAYNEHLVKIKEWVGKQPNMDVLYVNYNRLFLQPEEILVELTNFLEKPLPVAQMRRVIDPALYRNRLANQNFSKAQPGKIHP